MSLFIVSVYVRLPLVVLGVVSTFSSNVSINDFDHHFVSFWSVISWFFVSVLCVSLSRCCRSCLCFVFPIFSLSQCCMSFGFREVLILSLCLFCLCLFLVVVGVVGVFSLVVCK